MASCACGFSYHFQSSCNPQQCIVSHQCRELFSVHFRYHEGLTVDSNMVNKLGHIPTCVKQLFSHIVNNGDFS